MVCHLFCIMDHGYRRGYAEHTQGIYTYTEGIHDIYRKGYSGIPYIRHTVFIQKTDRVYRRWTWRGYTEDIYLYTYIYLYIQGDYTGIYRVYIQKTYSVYTGYIQVIHTEDIQCLYRLYIQKTYSVYTFKAYRVYTEDLQGIIYKPCQFRNPPGFLM